MPDTYQFHRLVSSEKNDYILYKWGQGDSSAVNPNSDWIGYVLPWRDEPENSEPPESISFSDSWTKYPGEPKNEKQGGCYLFGSHGPNNNNAFLTLITGLLEEFAASEGLTYRYFLWINNADTTQTEDLVYNRLPFTTDGDAGSIPNQSTGPLRHNAVSFGNIYLDMPGGTQVKSMLDDNTIQFIQFNKAIQLWNSNGAQPFGVINTNVELSLTNNPGALTFSATFNTLSVEGKDFAEMQAGIRYFIDDEKSDVESQWYPLWGSMSANVSYSIEASMNPIRPDVHDRTFFQFCATEKKDKKLPSFLSCFTTTYGRPISLRPIAENSKLVFMAGLLKSETTQRNIPNLFYLAPAGDFEICDEESSKLTTDNPSIANDPNVFLCGLNGTEMFSFSNETALRFVPDQPAYASNFPFAQASPVGRPVDPTAPLLDGTLKTSWISLFDPREEETSQYVSQPKGAPLYGLDDFTHTGDYPQFLGFVGSSAQVSSSGTFPFPMVAYGGLAVQQQGDTNDKSNGWNSQQIESFERQIISPTRRVIMERSKSTLNETSPKQNDGDVPKTVTTPTGLIATLGTPPEKWDKILLGELASRPPTSMYFSKPNDKLLQAFQTSDLMLVVANPANLGELGVAEGTAFSNILNIEEWVLQAQVGNNDSYGDYSNIVLVKGVKGKLYDAASETDSLLSNPKKWTQTADFSAPNGKQEELVTLSLWLRDYFENAANKEGDDGIYFEQFNRIAKDENWTGILVLRANIKDIPDPIKGIAAGVQNPSAFNAHHFGIEISQTKISDSGPEIDGDSSVFGLIYYSDPAWDSTNPQNPVAPETGSIYDFRLLDLKVLFENSAVKHFESYAQLTLNELYGSTVNKMGSGGNAYNSIILRGSFQENGGAPVYGLGAIQNYVFIMDNNIFNKIEIASAQMNTLSATEEESSTWFGLTGYLDFKILQQGKGNDAIDTDLLSFGSCNGEAPRSGLYFSNMGLSMDYPTPTPQQRTFDFTTQNIRFDIKSSTLRKNSLCSNFALEVESMITGDEDSTPLKQGFINIITDLRLSGVDGGDWHGLKFRLNLGTPGELAGKIGLNADLLIAWSNQGGKDSDYKINVGLHLPGATGGANLISLQNVLKLSFGPIRLIYAKQNDTSDERNFMLMLTSIALKFLGLMKIPPNGNTLFYLFGNPDSTGKATGLGWYAKYGKDGEEKRI